MGTVGDIGTLGWWREGHLAGVRGIYHVILEMVRQGSITAMKGAELIAALTMRKTAERVPPGPWEDFEWDPEPVRGNVTVEPWSCPECGESVVAADYPSGDGSLRGLRRLFEAPAVSMLAILAFPELDGHKRVAIGPCQRKAPLHGEQEEPVACFGHVIHRCKSST